MTQQVMNVICSSLFTIKFTRFSVWDKSETLSSKICMSVARLYKGRKCFSFWGIELQISLKYS